MTFIRQSYRVQFEGGNGVRLAGIVDRPQTKDRDSTTPVAVFSHCFTCNKDLKAITRISRRLATQGIAVLRFDMTGLGGSEGDFSLTNFSTNLADLCQAIRFAESELGPVSGLIGHSFGGAASLAIAAGLPQPQGTPISDDQRSQIGAVACLASPSDTQHLAGLLDRMNPAIQIEGQGEVSIGGITWLIRKQMLEDFRAHQLPDALTQIRSRVLVFHSPVDQTLGHDHALRIASLIQDRDGNPGCSVITLSDADHLLTSNRSDPPFVADMMAAFIHRYGLDS